MSAACLTVSSFDARLEVRARGLCGEQQCCWRAPPPPPRTPSHAHTQEAVHAVRSLDDKVLNLSRLVACTQRFAEQAASEAQGKLAALA